MSQEPWDYVLAAAAQYALDSASMQSEGNPPSAFTEPVAYWLNRAGSDAAMDFAKMVEMRIDPYVARLAIQLNTDLVMAMSTAQEILGCSYEEWSRTVPADEGTFGYPR